MKINRRTMLPASGALALLIALGFASGPAAFGQAHAASASKIRFEGGDGSSFATAILIKGAANEGEGVAAERTYVVLRHPDWDPREIDTALMEDNGRTYDLSRFRGRDGVQHALYFDISEFFGKF